MKKASIENTYQQGDVLLRKLDKIPRGESKVISRGRCILAHGESGHTHVVEDDEAELIQIGDQIILSLGRETEQKHDEHHARTLSPGIWEVGAVQEYDYLSKMARPVVD